MIFFRLAFAAAEVVVDLLSRRTACPYGDGFRTDDRTRMRAHLEFAHGELS